MEALGYLASLIMGITIGLLGGGGSILTVPILVYLFAIRPVDATASSLFIVGSTALVTAIQYRLRKEADLRIAILFAMPSWIGVYLARNILLPGIPESLPDIFGVSITKDTLVLSSFAVLMLVASFTMIRKKAARSREEFNRSTFFIGFQGILVGFVTGFVGAGGGFLVLPALTNGIGLPVRLAIGTSLSVIALNSLFGFSVSALGKGASVAWGLQLTILAIALVGSSIGARLSKNVNDQKLKHGFGWFVLVVGTAVLVERLFNR